MTICVGEVVAVAGVTITIRIFDDSNKDTLFIEGKKYRGVSIREYITIQRGFRDIICLVQGEYLDEKRFYEDQSHTYFVRKIDVKPIGYLEDGKFCEGIKYLPMIKDSAFLVDEAVVASLYTSATQSGLVIGKLLKEEIPISLPWQRLFNTHIGIFGNTGSGKSNTLTKLYTALFEAKATRLQGKSHFVLLDFNGEYTNDQLIAAEHKRVLRLRTAGAGGDRLPLAEAEFWNTETQAILFQATANTQRPFLNRIVTGREKFSHVADSLKRYFQRTFEIAFSSAAPRAESLDLLRRICSIAKTEQLETTMGTIRWMGGGANSFRTDTNNYFNADGVTYNNVLRGQVEAVDFADLDAFDEFTIRAHLQLTRDLMNGFVQFEHIQPLLKRAEVATGHLKKLVAIGGAQPDPKILTVISLRNCNQDAKKILPLLIAKHYYNHHRSEVASPPDRTLHLLIDEAHNILSEQSAREHEVWRDYRLELFEEIIKEGRKFGMFLTLSSQRPADISPTIVSQLHNFFIHRLVNERDLYLIENTISTLDQVSKSQIPNLSKGCCIVTGTSFDLPMTLQVDLLERSKQPDSEDVDLSALWADED